MFFSSNCTDVLVNSSNITSIEIVDNGPDLPPETSPEEYERYAVVAKFGGFRTESILSKHADQKSARHYMFKLRNILNRKDGR